jgi:hypothetical protein
MLYVYLVCVIVMLVVRMREAIWKCEFSEFL